MPKLCLLTAFTLSFLSFFHASCQRTETILPSDPLFLYSGRIDYSNPNALRFSYPGVMIQAKFEGNRCTLKLRNESSKEGKNYYAILVDGEPEQVIGVGSSDKNYTLTLRNDGVHHLTIFKRTESFVGTGVFEGLELEEGKKLLPLERPLRKMEFIGNSITCGYGNEGTDANCPFSPETENNYLAYGAITARNLKADYMAVAYSGKGVIQNYDKGTETIPVVYDQVFPSSPTPKWDFAKWVPDVVVINLGTNDFAHGIPDSNVFVNAYIAFVSRIRKNYPAAYIFCIEGCMTRDGWPEGVASLTTKKRFLTNAVDHLQRKGDTRITTYFLSTAKQGDFGCDWHPNVKRHQIMATELTQFIRSKMGW